jgi:hypothetical protein
MPSMLPLLYAREKLVISERAFDAETTTIIGEAFDNLCKQVRDKGQPDSLQESFANRLIEIAARGGRDPEQMCESVLISLGWAPTRLTIASPQQPGRC